MNATTDTQANSTAKKAFGGFAEYRWQKERGRWKLSPRWRRVSALAAALAAAAYLGAAWVKYAENKWIRDCAETSYPQICLFIFPDNIPFTRLIWAPDFLHKACENAREAHRAKLAKVLLNKAKTQIRNREFAKFFYTIFSATKLDPKNNEARVMAAQALFALRRDEDAMEALEESLPGLLADQEFLRGYILTSFVKERFARLLGVSKYYIAQPDTPPKAREAFLLAAAHCRFERGEFAECEKLLAQPGITGSRDALVLRCRIMKELGKTGEAAEMLTAAMRYNATDTEISLHLLNLYKETENRDGLKAASEMHLLRSGRSAQSRIKLLEALDPAADTARIDMEVTAYRNEFADNPAAMFALCEYAAAKGRTALCAQLCAEAEARSAPNAQTMRLLHIESHLATRQYRETVRLVDEMFIAPPAWLEQSRLQFDALRMVAHFALKSEDTGEIGFKRIVESPENLSPAFMEVVAQRLVEAGRGAEATRVIDLCRERNRDSVAALAAQVRIHLLTGGNAETPRHMRDYLNIKRPTLKLLLKAREVLGGDAYFFDETRATLVTDIELLINGHPVVKPVAPIAPKGRADR